MAKITKKCVVVGKEGNLNLLRSKSLLLKQSSTELEKIYSFAYEFQLCNDLCRAKWQTFVSISFLMQPIGAICLQKCLQIQYFSQNKQPYEEL